MKRGGRHGARVAGTTVLALLFVLGGCSNAPTRPWGRFLRPAVRVQLDLSSRSGTVGSPLAAEAIATNQGLVPVEHFEGCRAGTGLDLLVLAPAGVTFEGTLYREAEPYPAPAGDYTVVANFHGWTQPGEADAFDVERRETFHWAGP